MFVNNFAEKTNEFLYFFEHQNILKKLISKSSIKYCMSQNKKIIIWKYIFLFSSQIFQTFQTKK